MCVYIYIYIHIRLPIAIIIIIAIVVLNRHYHDPYRSAHLTSGLERFAVFAVFADETSW